MSTVSRFVENQSNGEATLNQLPLMHSCDFNTSRLILRSNVLKATDCKVFKDKLLYFFYGKPSYPVGEKVEGHRTDDEYCPVCFIVPLNKVSIHRAFPFDTGAFDAKMYSGFLHHNLKIEEFEMDHTIESIMKYIKVFFGNNENYLRGDALVREKTHDPYIDGLISLHSAGGTQAIDERANTVEIMTKNDVIVADSVEGVIVPESLLRDNDLIQFLEENDIPYIPYAIRRMTAPCMYHGAVVTLADQYVKGKKGKL